MCHTPNRLTFRAPKRQHNRMVCTLHANRVSICKVHNFSFRFCSNLSAIEVCWTSGRVSVKTTETYARMHAFYYTRFVCPRIERTPCIIYQHFVFMRARAHKHCHTIGRAPNQLNEYLRWRVCVCVHSLFCFINRGECRWVVGKMISVVWHKCT